MEQTILVISFTNLKSDPRVRRQINYLSQHCKVVAAGYKNPEVAGVEFIDVSFRLNKIKLLFRLFYNLFGFYNRFYWTDPAVKNTYSALKGRAFDLIIANDIESVPVALKLKGTTAKVIFDAHEFSPLEHDDSFVWRMLFKGFKTYFIRKAATKCDLMFTVCQGIAETYEQQFGLKPLVMTNASEYVELEPSAVNPEKIRLIHHGMAHPTRKIENMIELMDHVDERFELHLMLIYLKDDYYNKLKALAATRPNIKMIPAVPMETLAEFGSHYDIGMYLLEPTNFNNAYALPNKLFEFIQSRLAIVIGPSPEMARIVNQHDLGAVSADFTPESLAKELNKLTAEDIVRFKQNSHALSKVLNASQNMQLLHEQIDLLLN